MVRLDRTKLMSTPSPVTREEEREGVSAAICQHQQGPSAARGGERDRGRKANRREGGTWARDWDWEWGGGEQERKGVHIAYLQLQFYLCFIGWQ